MNFVHLDALNVVLSGRNDSMKRIFLLIAIDLKDCVCWAGAKGVI